MKADSGPTPTCSVGTHTGADQIAILSAQEIAPDHKYLTTGLGRAASELRSLAFVYRGGVVTEGDFMVGVPKGELASSRADCL